MLWTLLNDFYTNLFYYDVGGLEYIYTNYYENYNARIIESWLFYLAYYETTNLQPKFLC